MSDIPAFLNTQAKADEAKFWVIPAPQDTTAAVIRGQAEAPAAILAASVYLEPYDEEVANKPCVEAPIHTTDGCNGTLDDVQEKAAAALEANAVPVILGGEPAVSLGAIRALSAKAEYFTILHLSSRAGFKNDAISSPETSACVMTRALECDNLRRLVQVGISSVSHAESEVIFSDNSKIETFFSCDLAKNDDDSWHEDVIQELSTPVYLSIDLSCFSRSVIPSVGYPEPGGLTWWQVLRLLKKVSSRRRIAAIDIVDMIPVEGDLTGDFAAAKLCHKMMAYLVSSGKML